MKKWYMVIDVERCENCNNCFLSCKDEHCDNSWPPYSLAQPMHGQRWMDIETVERGTFPCIDVAHRPRPCLHCADPPCLQAAENGAVSKREDGIVLLDSEKAKGQKGLVDACPYGAIYWDEELEIPQKCALCAHLLDTGWSQTRCSQACPTGALTLLHLEEQKMQQRIDELQLTGIDGRMAKTGDLGQVLYKNLYRFRDCFIGGSVAEHRAGLEECLEGAVVTLYHEEQKLDEIRSDLFGDFRFDRLPENSGVYRISVEHSGYKTIETQVELGKSCSAGVLWLEKAC